MTIHKYKIGQRITVTRKDDDRRTEYLSNIQNINDGVFFITVPYKGEIPLVLTHNELVVLKYVSKDAAFSFISVFLGTFQETESLRLYKIKQPELSSIKRVQMRRFVRVPLMLDMSYRLDSSEEWNKSLMLDLSAGGLKMAVKRPLQLDKILYIYFQLPSKRNMIDLSLKARVVRCGLADEDSNVYHVGLQFIDINRGLEDTICSYVFEKQMEQIRKR